MFGLIDLCVDPARRRTGIASQLLARAQSLAVTAGVAFVILMADEPALYLRYGYQRVRPAHARWLGIEDRTSGGVIDRDLGHCFMVKSVAGEPWPAGPIDLLGYLF